MIYAEEYSVSHSNTAKSTRALSSLINICGSILIAKKRSPLRSTNSAPSAKRSSWNLCSKFAIRFGPIHWWIGTYHIRSFSLIIKNKRESFLSLLFSASCRLRRSSRSGRCAVTPKQSSAKRWCCTSATT